MRQEKPNLTVLVIASVVLERDGKYLLIQEKKPEVYGTWNLPGGRVDVGESLVQAAQREAREESGFEVKIGRQLILQHSVVDRPVLHAFSATITGGELKFPDDEILDAKWFTWEEVQKLKLRNAEYTHEAILAARK